MSELFKIACDAMCRTKCSNFKEIDLLGRKAWACACDMDNTKCVLCQSYLREQLRKKERENK